MVPAGTARESEYGREFPLFEVEATMVEPMFQRLYSFIFDMEPGYSATEMDRPVPVAIFVVNFDKVRMDPRNKEVDLDSLMYSTIGGLTEQELKKQEADYIYRYRYNGGGATQVWLSSGRFVVIDLSAGPCTYGKIETEEGSVSYRSMPQLAQIIFPRGLAAPSASSTQDIFIGQLGGLISTTIEHVIAPDVRFETVDMTVRLLIPIIVLHNHNRYNILQAGHNYSIDVQTIEREVKKMVHTGQEIIIISGSHALHQHEKLAVAVSKAMRSHSLHETKTDGRFHVCTKTYLDGHILAGLASAVGGLSAPYERASHIHERPIVNRLWAAGCHPFGPFSNSTQISQIFQDEAVACFRNCVEKGVAVNAIFYASLIDGFGKAGMVDQAQEHFEEMTAKGFVPDSYYYNVLIDGLAKAGRMDGACALYKRMEDDGCDQTVYTYTILIDVILIPWDPGGNDDESSVTAWGQAEIQGGRNVTISLLGCTGSSSGHGLGPSHKQREGLMYKYRGWQRKRHR